MHLVHHSIQVEPGRSEVNLYSKHLISRAGHGVLPALEQGWPSCRAPLAAVGARSSEHLNAGQTAGSHGGLPWHSPGMEQVDVALNHS